MMTYNLLDLRETDKYICKLKKYELGHSMLQVQIQRTEDFREILYVEFRSVLYFSGHVKWHGAVLIQGSSEECIKFVDVKSSDAEFHANPTATLFKFVSSRETVYIVAKTYSVFKESDYK